MRQLFIALSLSACALPAAANDDEPVSLRAEGLALFYEFRDLESRSHRERIRILEQAETCIQRAHDRLAYRRCEQIEQAERRRLRTELKDERQCLRDRHDALLERL